MAAGAIMSSNGAVPDRGTNLIVMMWILTVGSSITVIMRLAIRAKKAVLGWDDMFMFLCMSCFYGWSIVLTLLCLAGGERHIQDVNPSSIPRVQLLNWTSQVFGIIGISAGKISVAALILAILKDTHKLWQRVYLWTFCIVLIGCVGVACSLLTFLQCEPAARLWDSSIDGTCIHPYIMADFGTFTGSYFAFVDASLAFIPSTIFWSLRISSQSKYTLSIIFALNVLTCICAGIKTSYLSALANRTDLTWATYDIFAWVTAEFFLTAVCGTIPTLRPVLRVCGDRVRTKLSTKSYTRHTEESGSQGDMQLGDLRENSKTKVVSGRFGVEDRMDIGRVGKRDDIVVEKSYQVRVDEGEGVGVAR